MWEVPIRAMALLSSTPAVKRQPSARRAARTSARAFRHGLRIRPNTRWRRGRRRGIDEDRARCGIAPSSMADTRSTRSSCVRSTREGRIRSTPWGAPRPATSGTDGRAAARGRAADDGVVRRSIRRLRSRARAARPGSELSSLFSSGPMSPGTGTAKAARRPSSIRKSRPRPPKECPAFSKKRQADGPGANLERERRSPAP